MQSPETSPVSQSETRKHEDSEIEGSLVPKLLPSNGKTYRIYPQQSDKIQFTTDEQSGTSHQFILSPRIAQLQMTVSNTLAYYPQYISHK